MNDVRSKIIKAGVKNLHEFGYEDADETNIISDQVYSMFFERMLEDNKGHGFDRVINSILAEIEEMRT